MKKFLCYDTNDAASGKINVDNRGMLRPNSTIPSTNGSSYQQLVTDGKGGVKWEDKPFGDVKSNIPGEIYEAGYTEFDNVVIGNDLIISEEIWNVLLTKESSLIINDTGEQYEFSRETDARIEYTGDGNPSAGNLFVCKDSPKAYFCSARPDATLGVKYMVSVPYEYTKQIDPKYIKDMYYTQTIPGSDGPIITFQAYLNTISPLTLSEPLIVDAPYTVRVGDDKYKITCTAHGEQLYIIVPQGSLVVDDPINNPLVALWNGAVTNKNIEIVRESQEEVKQIDPKYIKDMYYDNLQSASYAIYTGGLTEFPRSELDIPLEMWKLLLDENATITDETTGSVMTNRTVVGSAAGEKVCYSTGLPGISSLFISTMYPQAYLVVSSAPDDRLGEKRTIKVSIGTIKQIDQKYIPPTTVIVNITYNEDGTYSADKTFDEVKALIESGFNVKCRFNMFNMFEAPCIVYAKGNTNTVIGFECIDVSQRFGYIAVFTPDTVHVKEIDVDDLLLPPIGNNHGFLQAINGVWEISPDIIIPSSTSGSSKKFKITVDDSGAITATEV